MPVARANQWGIQSKPVPVPYDKTAKISARSTTTYKTSVKSSYEEREEKYKRRQSQLTSQGYFAAPNVPYKGVGDPFYLDEQRMILHALGQWDSKYECESSSSSDEDEYDIAAELQQQKRQPVSAASIVLRRTKKDINTLQREVIHGRNMIRNVKLGHGLFDLIKTQQAAKQQAENEMSMKKAEQMRSEWQPPKLDSSSEEESEEEIEDDVELSSFMKAGPLKEATEDEEQKSDTESPDPRGRVSFLREEDGNEATISRSLMTTPRSPGRKKKTKIPRPYTPQHTNIMETKENVAKDALFRQLCVLHWILEAMALHTRTGGDNSITMSPITASWKLSEIGGTKTFPRDTEGMTWKDLVNLEISPKPMKRKSTRLTGMKPHRAGTRNHSIFSSYLSMASSATPALRNSSSMDNSIDETQSVPPSTTRTDVRESLKEDDDDGKYVSIFKYLNEDISPKFNEEDESQEQRDALLLKGRKERKKDKRRQDGEHSPKKSPRKSTETKYSDGERGRSADRGKSAGLQRESSRANRADSAVIRPKSSPQLIEFQANRASTKYQNVVSEMNQKFQEKKEDAALQLHEQLEQLEKQRFAVCQNKFIAINSQLKGSSFHRAVQEMRERSSRMFSRPTQELLKKKQQQGNKGNWYAEILSNIPPELQKEWYYRVILKKLGRYGLIEGGGQQLSKRTFLKVLERLREWEICSPDICAAIEFCREKVVEMSVEDFEEWFSQQFPKIHRPQTAPVGSSKKNLKGEKLQEALKERFQSAYSNRSRSGFRPTGQRSKSGYAHFGRRLSTASTIANPGVVVRPLSMR